MLLAGFQRHQSTVLGNFFVYKENHFLLEMSNYNHGPIFIQFFHFQVKLSQPKSWDLILDYFLGSWDEIV